MDTTITLREALAQAPDCQERAKAIISLLRNGAVLDMPLGAIEQLIEGLRERTYALWASAVLAPALTSHERRHLLAALRDLPRAADIWQVEALGFLAPYLPESLAETVWIEAWSSASQCHNPQYTALLQAKLIEQMPDRLRSSSIPLAYAQAKNTADPYVQAQALCKLLVLMEHESAIEARTLACSALDRIDQLHQRFLIAGTLARLSETVAERMVMLHAAIDTIAQFPDPKVQQWILHVLKAPVSEGVGEEYDQLRLRWIILSDAANMALAFLTSAEDQDATADHEL